eukprot:TRINITY_DN21905_c0_g1_i1.p1 TRINITY_DN21905_c0_g1~~TRINITY_DN21905_c0_g1_i1.p1  ORF type:complete len:321 (-),score=30.14 TRINITY_DN21905_c0_g1_i1:1321-2283(-)
MMSVAMNAAEIAVQSGFVLADCSVSISTGRTSAIGANSICPGSSSRSSNLHGPSSASTSVSCRTAIIAGAGSQSLAATSRQCSSFYDPQPQRLATSLSFPVARASTAASETAVESTEAALPSDETIVPTVVVPLESGAGVSYELLRSLLARGQWEAADEETRRVLCVLAGEGAAKRKWVYFSEVQFMPNSDLLTIDSLWRAYSNNKFGFSVQRRIWQTCDQRWKPFFLKIDWTYGENSTYKKFPAEFQWSIDAPTGHLPLTNALRGTQLLEKLFTHPAFDKFDAEATIDDSGYTGMATSTASPLNMLNSKKVLNSSDRGF